MNDKKEEKKSIYINIIRFSKKIVFSYMLIGITFVILLPFFLKISSSLRLPIDNTDPTVILVPANWTLSNFVIAYHQLEYKTLFFNTFLISLITSFIQVIITAIGGYAFSKLKFRGSQILFYMVLFIMVVPNETLHVSRYLFYSNYSFLGINLIGNIKSIFIMSIFSMGIRSSLFIYIFRQYFKRQSIELEESAQIDGAGIFKTFWKIALPSAKGALITVFLFSFVWQWNDFYYANLYNLSSNGFGLFSTKFLSRRMANIDAATLLMMFPLLVGYIFHQRYFVESFERVGIIG